jgi:hypothetical protein
MSGVGSSYEIISHRFQLSTMESSTDEIAAMTRANGLNIDHCFSLGVTGPRATHCAS